MDEMPICGDCEISFSKKKNLYAHIRKIHNKEPLVVSKISKKEICDVCGQQFINKSNLSRHVKRIHRVNPSNKASIRNSRLKCPVEDCFEHFRNYNILRQHVTSVHKLEIECNEFQFDSSSAFHKWKSDIEEQSLSLYVLHTSATLLADGSKKECYNCHRSYNYICKGKGVKASKSKGTNKIGRACPSRMEVLIKSNEGPMFVKFWTTHIGHSLDIGRVFLSKQLRAELAGKLKEGVTFEHILDGIRDANFLKAECQRNVLLEKKDLHNIVRDFQLDCGIKRHQNDAVSVKLWVEEMKSISESPVLLYKEQGVQTDSGILEIDDFALIIMTSFQVQQLVQFGNDKICIDGTHGTNCYDFQLYTLMTVDEFGSGIPVAFCFSNRADETIFTVFFENIKFKVGIIKANIFMSDDTPAFYNAWCRVMSPVFNRLLCTWHVDRNWRHNLSKISGGTEKKVLVYKTLRIILQCTSTDTFYKSMRHDLTDLYADQDTAVFAKYFNDHYANRPQCWAYCHRLGLGINTNMYLESLHRILKHIYLNGKKVKRLDKSINAVIKLARDSLFKRIIKLAKNSPTDKINKIRQSHVLSQKISLDMIRCLKNKNEFLVTSSTDKSLQYFVVKVGENCSDLCLSCQECNICLHTFKCTCTDNVIKLNICKHIHACASLFFKGSKDAVNYNLENNSSIIESIIEVSRSSQAQPSRVDDIKRKAELVIGLCNTTSLTDEEHRFILNKFDTIIDIMNGSKAIHLKSKQNINENQNVEKQVRLFSTKKRKIRNTLFKKPTIIEQKNIIDNLLTKTDSTTNIHTRFDHTYYSSI